MAEAEVRWNLLTEPLLGTAKRDGTRRAVTLPDVLEALGEGADLAFTALQPHQHHAWYAFLVQLAAIAVHRAGDGRIGRTADAWRHLLRELAGGRDEAFSLVVADLARPAFMQPPLPEGRLDVLKNESSFPDALDVLVTAKNHDVKAARITRPRAEHWAYALVSLQTMQGYLGAGNYGIARMNGGFASRPAIGVAPGSSWGARFGRDVATWLEERTHLVGSFGYASSGGVALTWIDPWDGSRSLGLSQLDPAFIEICRRVRLAGTGAAPAARFGTTKKPRIEAKDAKGNLGDPWVPIHKGEQKALTVSAAGFSYDLLQDLLLGDEWKRPAALEVRPADGQSPLLVAWAMVRGQGKTEGLQERLVPVPARARGLLASTEGRERLGKLARDRVARVELVRTRVLSPALMVLAQADPDKPNWKDRRMTSWLARLDQEVDAIFFERLFAEVDTPEGQTTTAWDVAVLDLAEGLLREAQRSVPVPSMRRYRALTASERAFFGSANRHLPDASQVRRGRRLVAPSHDEGVTA